MLLEIRSFQKHAFFVGYSVRGGGGGGSFLVFYGTFYDDVPSTSMVCFIRSCALSILLYCNTMPKYYCLIREGQYIQVLQYTATLPTV